MKRNLYFGAAFLALLAVLVAAEITFEKQADAQTKAAVMAPKFEVDPFWPKPLPNKWHIGQAIGVSVTIANTTGQIVLVIALAQS